MTKQISMSLILLLFCVLGCKKKVESHDENDSMKKEEPKKISQLEAKAEIVKIEGLDWLEKYNETYKNETNKKLKSAMFLLYAMSSRINRFEYQIKEYNENPIYDDPVIFIKNDLKQKLSLIEHAEVRLKESGTSEEQLEKQYRPSILKIRIQEIAQEQDISLELPPESK